MSNPLVFVAGMDRALTLAALLTGSALADHRPLGADAESLLDGSAVPRDGCLLSYTWSIQPSFTAAAWAQTAVVAGSPWQSAPT